MTKYIIGAVVVILLFSFSGKAYCWSLNDLKNVAQQATGVTNNAPETAINNDAVQKAEPVVTRAVPVATSNNAITDSSLPPPVDLKQAMYGIPLGGRLEDVLKWCKENNGVIYMPVIKAKIIGAMKDLPELNKRDYAILLQYSPSFQYNGQELLLTPLFQSSSINEEFAKQLSLDITPPDEIRKSGLQILTIYFIKRNDNSIVSYAVQGKFAGRSDLVKQSLNEKYGAPVAIYLREYIDGQENIEHDPVMPGLTLAPAGMGRDLYLLTKLQFMRTEAWKKNILFSQNLSSLFYIEDTLSKEALQNMAKGLDKYKEAADSDKAKIKSNF